MTREHLEESIAHLYHYVRRRAKEIGPYADVEGAHAKIEKIRARLEPEVDGIEVWWRR